MGNPGVLACGRLRASCTAPLPWSSPAKPNELEQRATPNEPERCGDPNEPERRGRASGLAFLAVCTNEPERAAISERTQLMAPFPEGTRGANSNEPERRLQTNLVQPR
jgi:hypothetical protein